MASSIEVRVPDIGGFKDVSVIDVLVKDGQQIDKETPLVTIETEKAAMDVPAPAAGKIAQVKLKTGDKVSEGSVILLLEPAAAESRSNRKERRSTERRRTRAARQPAPAPAQQKERRCHGARSATSTRRSAFRCPAPAAARAPGAAR